jgi:hypothetical protein
VAVTDFLHALDVDEIDVTNYHGAINDSIRMRVTDDFKVKQVQASIPKADGTLAPLNNWYIQTIVSYLHLLSFLKCVIGWAI